MPLKSIKVKSKVFMNLYFGDNIGCLSVRLSSCLSSFILCNSCQANGSIFRLLTSHLLPRHYIQSVHVYSLMLFTSFFFSWQCIPRFFHTHLPQLEWVDMSVVRGWGCIWWWPVLWDWHSLWQTVEEYRIQGEYAIWWWNKTRMWSSWFEVDRRNQPSHCRAWFRWDIKG